MAPPNNDRVRFTVYLDRPIFESAQSQAAMFDIPVAQVLRDAVAAGLGKPCTGLEQVSVDQVNIGV